MPFFKFLPEQDAAVRNVFMHTWDRFSHMTLFLEHVLRGPSEISERDRELIATYVSGLNDCSFCYNAHAQTAEHYGVDTDMFEKLMADVDTAPVDDRLKPILKFVQKLTKTPAQMVQGDADAVFAAGWSEDALHDAISVCCAFNFMNRLMDGHGVPRLSDEQLEATGGRLHQFGYNPYNQAPKEQVDAMASYRVPPKDES
ncbi:MAG: peroxidase-related enzyme [Pseudomonadota bacterium]